MNLSVLKASFRKCPRRRRCSSVVNCALVARSRISPWGLIKPYIPYINWTPSLAAYAIRLQVASSWFTQQRARNKLFIRNYSRGVQNAQYSTSDCTAIHKTGWIATLEGNRCITIFVMNQA